MSTVANIPKPLLQIIRNSFAGCHVLFEKQVVRFIAISVRRDMLIYATILTEVEVSPAKFELDVDKLSLVRSTRDFVPLEVKDDKLLVDGIEVGTRFEGSSMPLEALEKLSQKYFLPKTKIVVHESRAFRNFLSKAQKLRANWLGFLIQRGKVKIALHGIILFDPEKTVYLDTNLTADPHIENEIFVATLLENVLDLLPYDVFRCKKSPPVEIEIFGDVAPLRLSYVLYNSDFHAYIAPLLPDCYEIMRESTATREELEDFIAKLDDPEDKKKLQQLLHYLDKLS